MAHVDGASSFQVETRVGQLHVERLGAGPAIVLWPSLFCDGRTLAAQAADLGRDHTVLVIDGPGHGQSGPPSAPFSLAQCAQAALAIARDCGFERVVFMGNAWGGQVGLCAALAAPDRVASVIVANSPMQVWTGTARFKNWLLIQLYRGLGPIDTLSGMVADAMLSPRTLASKPVCRERLLDGFRRFERKGFASAMDSAMLRREAVLPLVGAIRAPVLVIAGGDDPMYPADKARSEAAHIPGARFEVVPDTRHMTPFEAPEATNAMVRSFLAPQERWS